MTAILVVLFRNVASATDGYEAMGYFVVTRYDKLGNPAYQNAMMFDLLCIGDKWKIRTEPVVECRGGIGYYECSYDTNGFILKTTALEAAYDPSQSPFKSLRAQLNISAIGDVNCSNTHALSATASKRFEQEGYHASVTMPTTNRIRNTSIAIIRNGKYPPVDPSGCALLWFAFTPPNIRTSGSDKMLLQVWDDGHFNETRFRQSQWNQFTAPPYLISNAVFYWNGKKLLSDGTSVDLVASAQASPLQIAARYEVSCATNINEFSFPLRFSLTRFESKRSAESQPRTLSTVVATVVKVSEAAPEASINQTIVGKPYVNDYRVSTGRLNGDPLGYLLESNSLPTVEQVIASRNYKRVVEAKGRLKPDSKYRFIVVLCILAPPFVCALLFWRRRLKLQYRSQQP